MKKIKRLSIVILVSVILGLGVHLIIKHFKTHDEYLDRLDRVPEIYKQMLKYTGVAKGLDIPLYIDENPEINAWTDGHSVHIYTGMIKYVKSDAELAGVIGHELGHALMQHDQLQAVMFPTEILEGNADKFSTYLMLRAGYDVCKAKDLWYRLREDDGDYVFNGDHPNYSYRYWQLDFPQCR